MPPKYTWALIPLRRYHSSNFLTGFPTSRHFWLCYYTNLCEVEPWSHNFIIQNAFNSSKCLMPDIQTFRDLNSRLSHLTSIYFSNPIFYYSLSHTHYILLPIPHPDFSYFCAFVCAIPTFLSNHIHILKYNISIRSSCSPTRKYYSPSVNSS